MAKDTKYIRKRSRSYGSAFLVEIPYTDDAGRRQRFTETVRVVDCGSEKAALALAQKIRNNALLDIAAGKIRAVYPTVGRLYELKQEVLPLSVATKEKQDTIFRKALADLADTPINKVSVADIQATINAYAENHSDDAIHRLMSIWKQLYRVCVILEYPIEDKTIAVVVPKSKKVIQRRNQSMTMADFSRILDAVLLYNNRGVEAYDSRCIWYLLLIMYFTGCRPAEGLALTRDDIHPTFISITKQVGSTSKAKRQIVPTKTDESVRRVPVAEDLRPILSDLLLWARYDLLLADRHGKPRSVSAISDIIHDVAAREGIDFHAYMLRHLMSTELINAGNSLIARDILGHSSFGMTLDYARSTDDQLYEALKARSLEAPAEFQPKNKRHEEPRTAILRKYWALRLSAAIALICWEKSAE